MIDKLKSCPLSEWLMNVVNDYHKNFDKDELRCDAE